MNYLNAAYKSYDLPLSSTPLFKAIQKIHDKDPQIAYSAMKFCVNKNPSFNRREDFIAATIMAKYFASLVDIPKAVTDSLKQISDEYNEKIADESKQQIELQKQANELQKKIEYDIKRAYRKLLGRERKKTHMTQEAIERIEATNKAYSEFMRLKAPVDYWQKKRKEHEKEANSWGQYLMSFAFFGGGALIIALLWLADHVGKVAEQGKPVVIYVLYATLAIATSTIIFWIGRILSKIYLGQYHLAVDAGERATMVQTYLALTKDNQANEADRAIILGALFRPTEDGIVRDDGVPDISYLSQISKMAGGKN